MTARQARALAGPVGITPAVGSKDFGPAAVEVLGPREAAPSRPGPSPATSWWRRADSDECLVKYYDKDLVKLGQIWLKKVMFHTPAWTSIHILKLGVFCFCNYEAHCSVHIHNVVQQFLG